MANTVSTVGTGAGCGTVTVSGGQVNGPDLVYQFTVGVGNNLTFLLTPTSLDPVNFPYDPAIYILSSCGNGTTCVGGSDSAGDNLPETLTVSGLAPGTYYFYVDSFYTLNVRRQGPYTLSVTGTLGAVNTPTPTTTATSTVTSAFTPTVTTTAVLTSTATPTPTNTPSLASPTPTPTGGVGPAQIPTLSGWTLGVFALSLAAAALYLGRRNG